MEFWRGRCVMVGMMRWRKGAKYEVMKGLMHHPYRDASTLHNSIFYFLPSPSFLPRHLSLFTTPSFAPSFPFTSSLPRHISPFTISYFAPSPSISTMTHLLLLISTFVPLNIIPTTAYLPLW